MTRGEVTELLKRLREEAEVVLMMNNAGHYTQTYVEVTPEEIMALIGYVAQRPHPLYPERDIE